jgi:hypothetical protein
MIDPLTEVHELVKNCNFKFKTKSKNHSLDFHKVGDSLSPSPNVHKPNFPFPFSQILICQPIFETSFGKCMERRKHSKVRQRQRIHVSKKRVGLQALADVFENVT